MQATQFEVSRGSCTEVFEMKNPARQEQRSSQCREMWTRLEAWKVAVPGVCHLCNQTAMGRNPTKSCGTRTQERGPLLSCGWQIKAEEVSVVYLPAPVMTVMNVGGSPSFTCEVLPANLTSLKDFRLSLSGVMTIS